MYIHEGDLYICIDLSFQGLVLLFCELTVIGLILIIIVMWIKHLFYEWRWKKTIHKKTF